jgi:hypothetical protein
MGNSGSRGASLLTQAALLPRLSRLCSHPLLGPPQPFLPEHSFLQFCVGQKKDGHQTGTTGPSRCQKSCVIVHACSPSYSGEVGGIPRVQEFNTNLSDTARPHVRKKKNPVLRNNKIFMTHICLLVFEVGSCYISQESLELLGSRNPPTQPPKKLEL